MCIRDSILRRIQTTIGGGPRLVLCGHSTQTSYSPFLLTLLHLWQLSAADSSRLRSRQTTLIKSISPQSDFLQAWASPVGVKFIGEWGACSRTFTHSISIVFQFWLTVHCRTIFVSLKRRLMIFFSHCRHMAMTTDHLPMMSLTKRWPFVISVAWTQTAATCH